MNRLLPFLAVGGLLALASPALAGPSTLDLLVEVERAPDYLAARDALVLDRSLADPSFEALLDHPDWRVAQDAAVVLGWRRSPDLFAAVMQAIPVENRAAQLRFVSEAFEQPAAFPAVLERFRRAGESEAIRAGLFSALVGRDPRWTEIALGLLQERPEGGLRTSIVGAMRRPEAGPEAVEVLRLGLRDPDAAVRAEAAMSVGWRSDGLALVPELLAILDDPRAQPRAMAARSLGWLGASSALGPLEALVVDASPEVRLHALRSIGRIDPGRARSLPRLQALQRDVDPRVARVAKRLAD